MFSPSSRYDMRALDPEMRHGRFPLALRSTSKLMGSPVMEWLGLGRTAHNFHDAETPDTAHLQKTEFPSLSQWRETTHQSSCPTLSLCCTPQHATPSAAGSARSTTNNCFRALRPEQAILTRRAASRWKQLCPSSKLSITVHTQDLDQHRKFKWQLGL